MPFDLLSEFRADFAGHADQTDVADGKTLDLQRDFGFALIFGRDPFLEFPADRQSMGPMRIPAAAQLVTWSNAACFFSRLRAVVRSASE